MSIVLDQITKRFGTRAVVNHLSLEIADGEFFVLLGPSGSGKSTVLRMIAGLTVMDGGRVLLHGRDVTSLLPQARGTGFVFQNYALFRHMSVADNVEFALRVRKMSAGERRRRRDQLLELVGLAGLGNRMPHQLSGGQQQRVALARALAHQPAVLLLDEPFGALDAKIRTELRRTLKDVQREIGMTTIFVTHDQEEAFELADRLGVMNVGRLLEVGPPAELYQHPQTEFVATFLGTANLLLGECTAQGIQLGPVQFPLGTQGSLTQAAQRVQVLIRPEDIALAPTEAALADPALGRAEVEHTTFVGSYERLRLRVPLLPGVRPLAPQAPFGSDTLSIEASRGQDQARRFPLHPGDTTWIGVHRIHALTHPGLRCLIVSDGTGEGQAALAVGGEIARLAHARTTLLGAGSASQAHMQAAKEQIGSGLPRLDMETSAAPPALAVAQAVERQPYDLLVLGTRGHDDAELVEQVLGSGGQHVLAVPASAPKTAPQRMLICVASGEPGKDDVLFAGRLARHLGASATLLSVLPPDAPPDVCERVDRFGEAGTRTLHALGVEAHAVTHSGAVFPKIMEERAAGNYDLLVVGAPLSDAEGHTSLNGVVGQIVNEAHEYAVLIVRSSHAAIDPLLGANGRIQLQEEIIR
jgi:sulfate transport system ATP-binding protein